MLEALNNIGDMLHNFFDGILSFFEKVGNTLIDIWELFEQAIGYVPVVGKVFTAILPAPVVALITGLLVLACIKLFTGRDG